MLMAIQGNSGCHLLNVMYKPDASSIRSPDGNMGPVASSRPSQVDTSSTVADARIRALARWNNTKPPNSAISPSIWMNRPRS